jgi:2-iminobutanoate/2-iminopropanoate deaminase
MNSEIITPDAPKPGRHYSQAILAGNTIYTAGEIALTVDDKLVDGSIEKETEQVLKNLKSILEKGGFGFKDVVKVTIFITDMALYEKMTAVYGRIMPKPYSARETICVKALPRGAHLEISMIAVRS